MPVKATVGKKEYVSTSKNHAEELLFASGKYNAGTGNFTVELTGWPCVGERGHNCHQLFKHQSANRVITVVMIEDHAGYAANHGGVTGNTGTITYTNGVAATVINVPG